MFQSKLVEKIKTNFVFNNFFLEDRAVYEIMWRNIVERGRPLDDNRRYAFRARYIRLQIQPLTIYNIYCFFTATIVARTAPILR